MHFFAKTGLALGLGAVFLSAAQGQPVNQDNRYQPRPYKIDVSPDTIRDIQHRAAAFHPTNNIAGPAWFDGPPIANVTQVAKYLASDYDWFAYQDAVNANFSHYITTLPPLGASYPHEIDVHFIHQKSKRKDAIPIILLHGWPSTSLEWKRVARELANPKDSSSPAFHVVAPDLPGFGFSPAPVSVGIAAPELATLGASLMKQLGYDSYAVYSTDLGFPIALQMLEDYEDHIIKHVADFYVSPPNSADLERYANHKTTEEESRYIVSFNAYQTNYSAYGQLHNTLPLSVAHALNDSPVGFLAWVWQLDYLARDLSVPYSTQELVSQVLTLFLPGVYGNIRTYKGTFDSIFSLHRKPSKVPTAITQWGYPKPSYELAKYINFVPKDWVERTANVTFFRRHEEGGHFPAETVPDLWLKDVRDIFTTKSRTL